jgi:hypothetical protein
MRLIRRDIGGGKLPWVEVNKISLEQSAFIKKRRTKNYYTMPKPAWCNVDRFFSTGYLASDHSLQPPLSGFA